ncbi:ATP-grasp domain-containing protein [Candidatus Daviesbacteria bacterium]|nr:ATP-grasp domain-containing protein [Candidatus Daviesbacteria bacterium]
MKVLVITGGVTSERRISLMSAREVKKGLEKTGHRVKLYDFKKGKISKNLVKDFDVIFPLIHGKQGEDGSLYGSLIKLGKPFVGCSPQSTKKAFDKILSNRIFDQDNFPRPRWKIVKNVRDIKKFGFPCVLKAASGGSSKEIVILHSEKDLKKALVKRILSLKDKFLVEQLIKGTEITVPVLFNQALPVIEIIPPENGWFDYKNKYSGQSQEIVDAPSVDKRIKGYAQKIALEIHRNLNLSPYSRTDFIVADNTPFVLEVNPACGVGLTSESLFPKAAKAVGLTFPRLLDQIVKFAYADKISKTK